MFLTRYSPKIRIIALMSAAALAVSAWAVAADGKLTLRSADMSAGGSLNAQQVYNSFGCSGKNVSPALSWSGAPAGTKSYAITLYDPDAPTGSGWWHWVVYNIPASATGVASGAGNTGGPLPSGALQGRTDFGTSGYGGPCPPAGDKAHRYIFTVYALKTDKIDVPADSSAAMVGFMLHANVLAKGTLLTRYGR